MKNNKKNRPAQTFVEKIIRDIVHIMFASQGDSLSSYYYNQLLYLAIKTSYWQLLEKLKTLGLSQNEKNKKI